jgi:GWxTD domain-containing protein
MKKNYPLLIILLFASALYPQIPDMQPTPYGFDINVKPQIYYDLFIELNPGEKNFQLNFAVSIQYDLLYFVRSDSGYISGYDISINIKDMKTKESVYSQLWKESVREEKFEITNSQRHYHVNSKNFYIAYPSGKYQLYLTLTDETSGREYKSNRLFEIPDISSDNYFSEINFLTTDGTQSVEIVGNDNQRVLEYNKDLYPLFQFKLSDSGNVRIRSELSALDGDEERLLRTQEMALESSGPFYRFEEVLNRKDLEEGAYLLRYTVLAEHFEEKVEKRFNIIWYQKPIPMYNSEMAFLPMRYLLSEDEWKEISDYSEPERMDWYKAYWKERDPDPETPLNEVQVEFYQRVMDANRRFRTEQYEGWNTDRGKALILYGDPDRIDAKRYLDNAKPYEIWYYEQRNEKLIFIDKDEDGSYLLVSIETIGKDKDE